VKLALGASAEEVAIIRELARELDSQNPKPAHEAMGALIGEGEDRGGLIDLLGGLHQDARATDLDLDAHADGRRGAIDTVEEAGLSGLRRALGTDEMDFLESMAARGHDPAEIQALFEKLRGTSSALPFADASELDEHGAPLASPMDLSPAETRLFQDVMPGRFEDLREGTRMGKIVPPGTAAEYAANKSAYGLQDTVGGFVTMGATFNGLGSLGALQASGLDSDWHDDTAGFFNRATNEFRPEVGGPGAGPDAGIDMLGFKLDERMLEALKVPLGSAASSLLLDEARRLATAEALAAPGARTEAIPRLLELVGGTLPHVLDRERAPGEAATTPAGGDSNPYTGWGFSSTRRAIDPATGLDLPVIPNQELVFPPRPRPQLPAGSDLFRLQPGGSTLPLAGLNGPGTMPTITSDPDGAALIRMLMARRFGP
jgi:hypothetical protein